MNEIACGRLSIFENDVCGEVGLDSFEKSTELGDQRFASLFAFGFITYSSIY